MTFRLELGIYPREGSAIPASEYLRRRETDPFYPATDTYYSALLLEVDGARYPTWGWGMVHLLVYQLDDAVARLRAGLQATLRSTADEVDSCLWLQPRGTAALRLTVADLRGTPYELSGIPEDDPDGLLRYLDENRAALLEPTGPDDVVCDVEIGPLDDAIAAVERMADEGRRVLADEARHNPP